MTLYGLFVLIHVIAAVVGLGASFGMPVVAKFGAKSVTNAKVCFEINKKIEVFAKVGSITLLASGILMAIVNPTLWSQGWFIGSLVIYVLIQPVVAGMLPKTIEKQVNIVMNSSDGELSPEYHQLDRKAAKLNGIAHVAAVVLIVLMSTKPF
ncbi:DUF2269 family protein [Mesobacillus selenatarsenatis]|uniref:DUF2269 family protein n=1 Tax=Mesobacillus selenatarsenatis TaxID=388741 RepID=A0A846TG68_9BACI|nr:DUF2269 family protein [Mesobacillus selenatarsenatis]